jgi:hypothetical protein
MSMHSVASTKGLKKKKKRPTGADKKAKLKDDLNNYLATARK